MNNKIIISGNCVVCGEKIEGDNIFLCKKCQNEQQKYVIHGTWVKSRHGDEFVTCSICKKMKNKDAMAFRKEYINGYKRIYRFCPVCGADMRRKRKNV